MTITRRTIAFSVLGIFLAVPVAMQAASLSGINMDEVRTKLYTRQGDEWFRALTQEADEDGVIEVESVIPGWYKLKVNTTDEKSTQYAALKLRMRDADGKELKTETPVDLYKRISDEKTYIGTVMSDDKGWIEVSGLELEEEYKLEIDEKNSGVVHGKDGSARVKVSAKIDGSEWFRALYERTDNAYVLTAENVLPGEYKFRYKNGDRSVGLPFILKARMVDEDGDEIEEATAVNLQAEINGAYVPVGQLMTDEKGWVTIPGVMTDMNYKVEVVE